MSARLIQAQLFPDVPLIIRCIHCQVYAVFYIMSMKPYLIRCNHCGTVFDENCE